MAETAIPPEPLAAPESPPAATAAPARRTRVDWRALALDGLLIVALGLGAYFRFLGQNWDQGTHLHPDERFFTMLETALQPVDSIGQYFDNSTSTLNPFNTQFTHFVYGQLPFVIVRYAGEWTSQTDYGTVHLVGRTLSALSDLLAILGIYLIGRRLYGRAAGLIAAGLSALAVMQIQQSHFFTPDNFATLFTVLTMYFAVLASQTRRWIYFALAGAGFGLAMATRINLLPLFGEIGLAAVLAYAVDLKDSQQRSRAVGKIVLAVAVAGVATLLAFRVAMPMAFGQPGQKTSFFSFAPNTQWLEQMRQASAENSGVIDAPPGKQWTNRPAILFPLTNMVLWGMGLPLGLLAWAGFGWAAWRALKGDWKQHALPLTWAGGYFLFMGTRWVKSVRYFLPIYPFLILLGAWAVVELWRVGRKTRERREGELREIGELEELPIRERTSSGSFRALSSYLSLGVAAVVFIGSFAWAFAFTRIYARDYSRVAASKWIYRNLPGMAALEIEDSDGRGYVQLPFGGAVIQLDASGPFTLPATLAGPVTIRGLTFAHIAAAGSEPVTLHVQLYDSPGLTADHLLAEGQTQVSPAGDDLRGPGLSVPLPALAIESGGPVYVVLSAEGGGRLTITGAAMANESWDDPLPVGVEGYPGWNSIYRNLASSPGGEIHPYNEDDELKRQDLAAWLDEADYLFISSQRAMWSLPRLPQRYPLMMKYYQSLFDGSLGFDLVASFQSNPTLGPLRISDVGGQLAWGQDPTLPVYNDNPLASEEAFSVYDHPPVWVFRKRADYDPAQARAVLDSVDLRNVVRYTPREAGQPVKSLMLTPERLAEQRQGGTWSDMFDRNALLNRVEPLGAAAWWLAFTVLGWLAFPLAFVALRGLPDAGYPVAKILALLVVAWLAWIFGSVRLLPFTRLTLMLCVLLLAAASAALAWPRRAELRQWLRLHKRYIVLVEALALAFFVFDLLIRWGNSDLWHVAYGGEKPMDFSYFNAVLKSTSFPAYDPWFAGGYINYYYFGFVIAAVLTKLLGLVPSFAYNLILPMLFSATGMGAFCVAFNLVKGTNSTKEQQEAKELREIKELGEISAPLEADSSLSSPSSSSSLANSSARSGINPRYLPYLAGIAAALLVVVLGNLGEVQVLSRSLQAVVGEGAGLHTGLAPLDGLSRALAGGWEVVIGGAQMPVSAGTWYWNATRIIPPGEGEAGPITEFPFFTFLYADLHAHMIDLPLTLLALAWSLSLVKHARSLQPEAGLEALEIESNSRRRSWLEWAVTFFVGGLTIGALNPTNTWDYPAYLLIGVLAVGYATWLRPGPLTLRKLAVALGQVILLAGLTRVLYLPYTQWYGAGYTSAELWRGSKTPIGSFLFIYGLYLFLFVSLLVNETRRWLAETPAEVLKNRRDWLGPLFFALIAFAAFVGVLVWMGYPTAAVVIPLATWAGLILLRRNTPPERRFGLMLIGLGLGLASVVEVVVLKGDISRMNTVFKFYLQVWVLFGVAGGACLAWVLAGAGNWRPAPRRLWWSALIVLVGSAGLYTVMATAAKVDDRMAARVPRTLDGMVYMSDAVYHDRDQELRLYEDYDAIRWMQDNVAGSPVIAEGHTPEYRWGSRFTIYTGLPGVVGWNWHQRQQRAALSPALVTDRVDEIDAFYFAPDPDDALGFIHKYDVRYIVVGDLEKAYYTPDGLAKFETMVVRGDLKVVYQSEGGTRIYEVVSG